MCIVDKQQVLGNREGQPQPALDSDPMSWSSSPLADEADLLTAIVLPSSLAPGALPGLEMRRWEDCSKSPSRACQEAGPEHILGLQVLEMSSLGREKGTRPRPARRLSPPGRGGEKSKPSPTALTSAASQADREDGQSGDQPHLTVTLVCSGAGAQAVGSPRSSTGRGWSLSGKSPS